MPGTKGNKNAVGNSGGRPRFVTGTKEELIELGKELVAWATEETDELRCRFPQFYSLKKGILDKEWELIKDKVEFHEYYEKARVALANRFLDGSVKEGIAHRFLRIYAPEVRKDENEKMRFEYDLKAKSEQSKYDEASLKQLQAVMDQVKEIQDKKI
jgi:hypothetical protein